MILLVGIVVPLLVSTYDQQGARELFGFPFFYWYQLVWVFICAGALRAELLAAADGNGTRYRRASRSEVEQ